MSIHYNNNTTNTNNNATDLSPSCLLDRFGLLTKSSSTLSTASTNYSSASSTLLSPTNSLVAQNTNNSHRHINNLTIDNSDGGSVDSDYTSLASSKLFGNGSSNSLHRQGRSQSIDELAQQLTTTTTFPTRHFSTTSNYKPTSSLMNDPLQFVKVQPNHDLIERAQEQLTLTERRRLQENNLRLNNLNNTNSNTTISTTTSLEKKTDDDTDWSKVSEIFLLIDKSFISLACNL
ncbi:unnamed protein product [Didymodactylos carnosus]|uniref:Uncharacterized protein n=1 Tax=Didymodactylos carnosus TaxID=1234261 RepID=A0A813T6B8_9BILA|nr:unnamed protein product [Didymodactylos carnosus]CAF0837537.1 unnamed protein product [Didymodactylos carnosus]CAF3591531.1 unnamed protein product [Didymodactylos carnosus]CAF3622401.1 unnamed protein product [Didymodactylos carnosus]